MPRPHLDPACQSSFELLWFFQHRYDQAVRKSSPHTYASLCHRLRDTHLNIASVDLKFLKTFVFFQASALRCQELQSFQVLCILFQNYRNRDPPVLPSFWLHLASTGTFEMIFAFYMCISQRSPSMMLSNKKTRMREVSTCLTLLASHCLCRFQSACTKQNQVEASRSHYSLCNSGITL